MQHELIASDRARDASGLNRRGRGAKRRRMSVVGRPQYLRRLVLLAIIEAAAAGLALPSVLTTRSHNATAYVVAAAPGGCGAVPHLRVACGRPRRAFADALPAALFITRCAFSKASCRCPDGGARACSTSWVPDHERQVLHRFRALSHSLAKQGCEPGDPRCDRGLHQHRRRHAALARNAARARLRRYFRRFCGGRPERAADARVRRRAGAAADAVPVLPRAAEHAPAGPDPGGSVAGAAGRAAGAGLGLTKMAF